MPLVYATPQAGERLSYAHTRPIAVPESFSELAGPATGVVELPLRLNWTPRRYYDLSKPSSVRSLYETVLRSAIDVDDVTAYINGDLLMAVWGELRISSRIRTAWEQRFAELRP